MYPLTLEFIKKICPTAKTSIAIDFVKYFNIHADKYGVNTPLRICHFLGQVLHESAHLQTREEYASGKAYDTRTDLGNTPEVDGDGELYKGRGYIQLTGKINYRTVGKKLNLDLEKNPLLVLTPEVSMLVTFEFWKMKDLNKWADQDNIIEITRLVNGGKNGLAERISYCNKAKKEYKLV